MAIPIVQAIISNSLLERLPELTEELDPRYILSLGISDYDTIPGLSKMMRILVRRAMSDSIRDAFRFTTFAACTAILSGFWFGGRHEVAIPLAPPIPLVPLVPGPPRPQGAGASVV